MEPTDSPTVLTRPDQNTTEDGRTHIQASSVQELNDWWVQAGPRRCLAVSGRYETRGGQLVGLGGLDWCMTNSQLVVTATSGEFEELPELPVVLASGVARHSFGGVR